MPEPLDLRLYLHQPMLGNARRGKVNFLQRLTRLLEGQGWRVQILPSGEAAREAAPDQPGYALFHMEKPTHDLALTFRRAYHYPFWRIEQVAERWRWPVAEAAFSPDAIDPATAQNFLSRLAARVLPGPAPRRDGPVLIPLQGRIAETRSFQTLSPLDMVARVAQSGRPCVATLHPRENYSPEDRAALEALATRHPNLTVGGKTAALLRDCAFVVTQNSAVAFDGFILGKPAVLFAQVDFHHIGLKVADLGVEAALAAAHDHRPDFARYLFWFLQMNAINMSAPDADRRIAAALARGGWPVAPPA
ncbi:hypothetical protein [Paracoccus zhejiangensis]|uniref:Capsular biosynthesis protein n=1 Tax=Paracoccus zhejiangensis TaxID=1077935 RepID=A0A2H5F0Q5_9RHOB|nr:hypothetical protein [Paracoccus zhejiangensis]AUH65139.1 hypothetical protein CX676_13945 [Paracoccus zhejiangensis]